MIKRYIQPSLIALMAAIAGTGLQSCVNDDLEPCAPADDSRYYMEMSVVVNNEPATRAEENENSTTEPGGSTGGTQNGQTNEDLVERAVIYLYEDTGAEGDVYITQFTVSKQSVSNNATTLRTEVKIDDLKPLAGKKIAVYMVANTTNFNFTSNDTPGQMNYQPKKGIIQAGATVDEAPLAQYTKAGGEVVPMSNYERFTVDLTELEAPANDEANQQFIENLKRFLTGGKTLDLSNPTDNPSAAKTYLMLERDVARLDYKPGKGEGVEVDDIYRIGSTGLYGKINALQVFNVSKNEFMFRQTNTGNEEGAAYNGGFATTIFGTERGTDPEKYNWIADYDWDTKLTAASATNVPGNNNYFLNQPVQATYTVMEIPEGGTTPVEVTRTLTEFYYIPETYGRAHGRMTIAEMKSTETDAEGATVSKLVEGYYPWQYVMENTLPSTETMVRGLTTGIAFEVLLAGENGNVYGAGTTLATSVNDAPYTGSYTPEFTEEANGFTLTRLGDSDYYTLTAGEKTSIVEAIWHIEEERMESNGTESVMRYKILDGFKLTYWYFIRHNLLNYVEGSTGPMQFGVVRNNIYRLNIKALNDLPEPYDPNDPDEPEKGAALSIELRVLPWALHDVIVKW